MTGLRLYAVTASGPVRLPLAETEQEPRDLHELFDTFPLGVYTVFRTFQHNKFLHLAAHFARLETSMRVLGWAYQSDWGLLRTALHEVCTAYPAAETRVRVDILRQPLGGTRGEPFRDTRLLVALAPFRPVPERYYREGVAVGLAPALERAHPRAKQADFVLARRRYPAGDETVFERLLIDADGNILEGLSSNFYAVRDGAIWTAEEGVLEGITRGVVLRLVRELNIPFKQAPVALANIGGLEEAYLSSSSRGVVPIVSIEEQQIGDGRPGPLTRRLMDAYTEYVAETVRPAVQEGATVSD